MRLLIELARVLELRRRKKVRLLRGKNRAMDLFRLIRKKKVEGDEAAKKLLYGDDPHGQRYLYDVKNDLQDRLVNTLLCLPQEPTDSKALTALKSCTKELALIQHLRAGGGTMAAVSLAGRTLKKAVKYQFTDIALAIARILLQHYSIVDIDEKKFARYCSLAEEYKQLSEAEYRLEQLYGEVAISHTITKTLAGKGNRLADYRVEILGLMARFPRSYRVNLIGFNLLSYLAIFQKKYKEVVAICRKAKSHFQNLSYSTPVATLFSFSYRPVPSLIQLEEYEEARRHLDECFHYARPGSHNWLVTLHYQAVLGFYSRNYRLAYEAIIEIKQYRQVSKTLRELLLIDEAYVVLFQRVNYLEGDKPPFRVGKFLNEVPTYSKDKRGMNINILILQILFLLLRGKMDQIIDRTDALAMYQHRYLRRDEHFRSNCFIRLLLLLPKNSFNPVAVARHAAPLLEKLEGTPLQADYDVEIVPYPILWELVMKLLHK